jgi:DNA invertase Pin-like site-specific DNA recombinase
VDARDAGTRHPARPGDRLAGNEIDSGASQRERRERLLEADSGREIDVVRVWRLDRWGRWVTGLLAIFQELGHLGVRFASLTEVLACGSASSFILEQLSGGSVLR